MTTEKPVIRDIYGYVTSWNSDKGYGWVRIPGLLPNEDRDEFTNSFVHASEVYNKNDVKLGAWLNCDVFQNDRGYRVADGAVVVDDADLPEELSP
jgi:cold shock CspA family protein